MIECNYLINETVFIGDSDSDKAAADNNKIHFIAVTDGEKLKEEKFVIRDLLRLESTLKKY